MLVKLNLTPGGVRNIQSCTPKTPLSEHFSYKKYDSEQGYNSKLYLSKRLQVWARSPYPQSGRPRLGGATRCLILFCSGECVTFILYPLYSYDTNHEAQMAWRFLPPHARRRILGAQCRSPRHTSTAPGNRLVPGYDAIERDRGALQRNSGSYTSCRCG